MTGKTSDVPTCNPAICVLAIEAKWPGCWGRSTNPKGAMEQGIKAGGSRSSDWIIWIAPPGAWVTGMGGIQWRLDHESYDAEVLSDAIRIGSIKRKPEPEPDPYAEIDAMEREADEQIARLEARRY